MKSGLRIAICVGFLLLFSLYLLEAHLQDICNQYRAGAYLVEWLDRKGSGHGPIPIVKGVPDDKVIVMAKLEEEPTDWVQEELPEYVFFYILFNSPPIASPPKKKKESSR